MKLDFLEYKLVYEGPVYDPSYFLLEVWISPYVSIPIEFNREFKADSYSSFFSHEEVQGIVDLAKPWLQIAETDDSIKILELITSDVPFSIKKKESLPQDLAKSLMERIESLEADITMIKKVISDKLFVDIDKKLKRQ